MFPGILETLNELNYSSIALAIATNESRENLDKLTAAMQIGSFFHLTICYDEVLLPKPSPDMARRLIDKLHVSPERTLIVGDSVLDIEMGKASGCQTCSVTYGAQSKNRLHSRSPNWIIEDFSDILDIINPVRKYIDRRSGNMNVIT